MTWETWTHHSGTTVYGVPTGHGLRHPWEHSTGLFLYPAEYFFVTFMAAPRDLRQEILDWNRDHGATHFEVGLCTYPSQWGAGFDGRTQIPHCREVLQQIIDSDLAPVVTMLGNTFIKGMKLPFPEVRYALERFTEQLQDLFSWAMATIEIGEIYREYEERLGCMDAIRRYTAKPIGIHERVQEYPYEKECDGYAPTISAVQFGFDRVATQDKFGRWVLADETKRNIAHNLRRLTKYGNKTMSFEHSIPFIAPNQPWKPWRTLAEAQSIGQQLIGIGCCSDMNGGAR
jgi:hypothetical protein